MPKSSIGIAYNMAKKAAARKMSHGGTCYACGGVVKANTNEGGIAEEEPLDLLDQTTDDLIDSPEGAADPDIGETEHADEGEDNDAQRNNFLRAYLIHKKVRPG